MKILITGAQGFTGKYFQLTAQNYGYVSYALKSDLKDFSSVKKEVNKVKPDFIVHLAGITFVDHKNPLEIYDVNVLGTMNLLDAIYELDCTPKKILIASSANIYGNTIKLPINEKNKINPMNHYAMSKALMERMSLKYISHLPIIFTRPFNYIGKGQSSNFVIPKIIDHFVKKKNKVSLGNIDVKREFNDVRDVCKIYIKLLEKSNQGEIYNVCSGKYFSLKEIISIASSLTGHSIMIEQDSSLMRENDIEILYGSNAKLIKAIGDFTFTEIDKTLSSML